MSGVATGSAVALLYSDLMLILIFIPALFVFFDDRKHPRESGTAVEIDFALGVRKSAEW